MKQMMKDAAILFAITLISGLLLGIVYQVTKDPIAKQNEKLWDIAKKFSSDIELIKKENNITCESLDSNKVIIIPGL